MSVAKFTPGPWEYHDHSFGEIVVYKPGDDEGAICVLDADVDGYAWRSYYSGSEEQKCNTSLIAAAPELYAALESLLSRISLDVDSKNWFIDEQKAAEEALAKARGES